MAKIIDLTGKRFGKLKVIKQSKIRGNRGQIKWDCVCDCGSKHIVTGESLRGGKSKSCGCYKQNYKPKNMIQDRELAILKFQYAHLVRRHKKRFKTKVISLQEYCEMVKDKCGYCGVIGLTVLEDRRCWTKSKGLISNTIVKINGLDRKNSDKGYTKDNVVTCCKHCNIAKNTMTEDEFYKWIKKVYEYNF